MRTCRWAKSGCGPAAAPAAIMDWSPSTQHLGSREYARLRIGIGRNDAARQITGHVLGRFHAAESARLEQVLERAAGQLQCWLDAGIQKAMSQFNGAVSPTNEEK